MAHCGDAQELRRYSLIKPKEVVPHDGLVVRETDPFSCRQIPPDSDPVKMRPDVGAMFFVTYKLTPKLIVLLRTLWQDQIAFYFLAPLVRVFEVFFLGEEDGKTRHGVAADLA